MDRKEGIKPFKFLNWDRLTTWFRPDNGRNWTVSSVSAGYLMVTWLSEKPFSVCQFRLGPANTIQ